MKSLKTSIKKTLAHFGLRIQRTPIRFTKYSYMIQEYSIPPNEVSINSKRGTIILLAIDNIEIELSKQNFILEAYNILKDLHDRCNAKLSFSNTKTLVINIDTQKFNINSGEELIILKEIYIDGIYNLNIHQNSNAIFIDIGMNVGMTSLFFARKNEIKAVYSFEPFKDTYQLAESNISLNPEVANKLNIFNYGLGESEHEEYWDYDPDFKGCMGTNGLPAYISPDKSGIKKVKVEIKDVSKELDKILQENPDVKKILKIDCEGSEYGIFNKLSEKNLLKSFDYIMLEWHFRGPEELKRILLQNQFSILSFDDTNPNIGMIYAFNNSKNNQLNY